MDLIANESLDECLSAAEMYFRRDWPYAGYVNRSGGVVTFVEQQRTLKTILGPSPKGARVFAERVEEGARLTLVADRARYARTLEAWARERFG